MFETVVDLKPDSPTATLYSPGSINGKSYSPSLLVVAWRVSPVAMRVRVTSAPATTAPLESVISPPISVELVCAGSDTAKPASQMVRAMPERKCCRQARTGKLEIGLGSIFDGFPFG